MTSVLRVGLAVLVGCALVVGVWNLGWPEHFFAHFPGVDATPPFAEHFARDFGGASTGLGIVLAVAAVVPRSILVVPALIGMAAFAVPHAVFHSLHTHGLTPGELVFNTVATWGQAALTVLLLALAAIRHARSARGKASTG